MDETTEKAAMLLLWLHISYGDPPPLEEITDEDSPVYWALKEFLRTEGQLSLLRWEEHVEEAHEIAKG